MMRWLRLWTDAIDDEKLKLLAFEDRWHYIAILCMKRKGILDVAESDALKDRKVGAMLGVDDRNRDEIRRRLVEVALIDEEWQPLGWDKRQFSSDADPTALERKQKQRSKAKKSHGRVTRDKHVSHAHVTPLRLQTPDSDSDTDSEKNQEPRVVEQKLDDGPVERVFEHWRSEYRHPKAVLDPKRRRVIQRALERYDEPTLRASISGYRLSPHHMGQNSQGTVYDDICLFLRDAEHIDRGLNCARAPPVRALSAVEIAQQNLRKSVGGMNGSVVAEQDGGGEGHLVALGGLLRGVPPA